MSKSSNGKHHAGKGGKTQYLFRLFMAGNGQNSQKALANLETICREHLNGNCTIEKIDVVKNFEAAVRDNILITPALLMVSPRPRVMVLGTLSDRQKVLHALRFSGGGGVNS